VEFLDPASPYIIGAVIATIIASYVLVVWKRVSFIIATAGATFIAFIIYFGPGFYDQSIYIDTVSTLGFRSTTLVDGGYAWGLVTHMYIHAGVLHLAFNLVVMLLMGLPFEQRVGARNTAIVYLLSGALGGGLLNTIVTNPSTLTIGVGASGAISGIIGAFAVMYPRDRIPMVLGFIIVPNVPVALGALVFLAFETALMFVGVAMPGVEGNVSHTAHLAALVVGVIIGYMMLKAGVEAPTESKRAAARIGKLDLEALRGLARSPQLEQRLEAVEREDIPEVREALLEDFVARARCPDCDSILQLHRGAVRCAKCEFRLDLRQAKGASRGK
jgi:membrane associated rhomboid family serine protease